MLCPIRSKQLLGHSDFLVKIRRRSHEYIGIQNNKNTNLMIKRLLSPLIVLRAEIQFFNASFTFLLHYEYAYLAYVQTQRACCTAEVLYIRVS